MIIRTACLLALLLTTGAPTAFAQTGASADFGALLRQRLDPSTRTAVQPVIDSAAANGLPLRPLVSKALEGSAKHAESARIVAAVRSLAADLGRARDAIGDDASEDALVAGAGALRAGVSPDYIRDVRETRGAPAVAWPLIVLADLVGRGVPVDTAAGVVLVLARAGAADNAYLGLEDRVRSTVPGAAPPAGAAPASTPPASAPRGSMLPVRPSRPSTPPRP